MMSRWVRSPVAGTVVFGSAAIFVFFILVWAAWLIYKLSENSPFFAKLGDLTLQLSVLVIVGAVLKELVDWGTSQHSRHRERIEKRMDFMRRARAMHLEVAYARDLLNAHRSGETYGERLRRLILLRGEIGEIVEDLRASPKLFEKQDEVMAAFEAINDYLDGGRVEYIRCHDDVDADARAKETLSVTIERKAMAWVRDFMEGGALFRSHYDENLDRSKGSMRQDVFGA